MCTVMKIQIKKPELMMSSMPSFINAVFDYFRYFRIFSVLPVLAVLFFFHQNSTAQPFDRETPVVRTVRMISPAVVNISSEYEIQQRAYPFSGRGPDSLFDFFYRDFFDPGFERKYKRTRDRKSVV